MLDRIFGGLIAFDWHKLIRRSLQEAVSFLVSCVATLGIAAVFAVVIWAILAVFQLPVPYGFILAVLLIFRVLHYFVGFVEEVVDGKQAA